MTVFADTSALIACVDADDAVHAEAVRVFTDLLSQDHVVAHNYIVVEAMAVVQRRVGQDAARLLLRDVLPAIEVRWIEPELHGAAVAIFMTAGTKRLSFVDLVSFEFMRRASIRRAFAFDEHFRKQGFEVVP